MNLLNPEAVVIGGDIAAAGLRETLYAAGSPLATRSAPPRGPARRRPVLVEVLQPDLAARDDLALLVLGLDQPHLL